MSEYLDLIKRGGNEALKINGPAKADFHITSRGSDWLFTVFCIYTFACIIAILLMFKKPANERFVYYTIIIPYACMAVNYFTMASNLGWAPVVALYNRNRVSTQETNLGTRQIFYSRLIGWFLAMPWPVIQLSLMGKTPIWHIIFNCFFTELFVIGYLVACVVHSTYKWGYYTFGTASIIVTLVSLMTTTKNLTKRLGEDVTKIFTYMFGLNAFIWLIYPICFGLSEAGNVIVPDSEHIFYGIIDLIYLGVLPAVWLVFVQYVGLEKMGLDTLGAEAELDPLPSVGSAASVTSKKSESDSGNEEKKKSKSPLDKLKLTKKEEN
ncbi:similar to Saccharomyces cerevisiae YDR033W MRH1 Protein that localizes primarily to the plasma membrane, also found at the nuclear envelope [Maudiozyma saulgeensis]|uniref:Similar to Saccharomyces cerevisiae YDR033W MRH1 Protein that localizes primarily to the plasma membrane, also found at the nuclear envelope n=1 Tax=Maudiozyma saulgeensis TaxID=1789683 RepID=A0A1X7R6L3_9SACH|nr:similar to Saccharomyces cerevisiae YDR033W MRH1 Protein that localizes primarily to the plasma membrane, also found at the nuclear envelope [Kazachstania saulgeensis]